MKYGESIFDIGYLLFTIILGYKMVSCREKPGRYMGLATLVLGFGDAFHLIPRVLNYFLSSDFTAALGIGKLITSVTMTVFYILVYRVWLGVYGEKENKKLSMWLYVLSSFLFYIPVATVVSFMPMLGMLMLPKTVCYMLMVWSFFKYTKHAVI